ncbi:MAG: DUF6575 domain-containing protein [Desulfococcaceae bacterium]|jgi:hypothetical protein|nr:DUF6575 domain-containing protein [Desulfococcaceae bacterium]
MVKLTFLPQNKIPVFPEDDGCFDNIKTLEIIESYDGPKIFTFLTQSEDYYLAWFGDDLENGTLWMVFPVNNYQLDKLLRDRISIRDFFRLARICHLIKRNRDGKVRECETRKFDEIPDDLIPDEDVFLENFDSLLTVEITGRYSEKEKTVDRIFWKHPVF